MHEGVRVCACVLAMRARTCVHEGRELLLVFQVGWSARHRRRHARAFHALEAPLHTRTAQHTTYNTQNTNTQHTTHTHTRTHMSETDTYDGTVVCACAYTQGMDTWGKGAKRHLAGFQFVQLQAAIFFTQRERTLVVVAVRETHRHQQ
jgi:hypothetical protein